MLTNTDLTEDLVENRSVLQETRDATGVLRR